MKPTAALAAWAAEPPHTWPDDAVRQSVRAFIDTIACMLSGAREPPVAKAYSAVHGEQP
jgi:2-methylcitrate dehydratase PrpD